MAADVRIRQEEIETNGSLRRAVFFFYADRSIATRLYRSQSPSRCCALLISNNVSKLFFQPCVLLLEGFDDVLERQHIGRLGAGWQRTRWRDLLLVKVNHHESDPILVNQEPLEWIVPELSITIGSKRDHSENQR